MYRSIERKQHTGILCLLLCLLLTVCTGCGAGETKLVLTTGLASDEVFRIESISCFKPEMMVYLTNMQNQYEAVYGQELWNTQVDGESLESKVKENALAKMAQVKTMNLMAKEMGITLDTQEEKQIERVGDIYYDSLNPTEIEAMGVERKTIYSLYREYLIAEKVYKDIIKDINPEVSDDEARNITIDYILIKTYAQDGTGKKIEYDENSRMDAYRRAQEVRDRAASGEDFDALIIEYNEDSVSTKSLGTSDLDDGALENTLFAMANDEISDVLTTDEGYIVVKLLSTYDLEETDLNKLNIVEQQREETFGKEYDEFVTKLTRKLNDTLWNEMTFLHDSRITTSDFFSVADENLNL